MASNPKTQPLHALAGTDVAALIFLDPQAQAPDFDEQFSADSRKALAVMMSKGRGFWCDTGADGPYLAHIFVDAEIPSELAAALRAPIEMPSFVVRSGRVLFAGSEFSVPRQERVRRQYPGMGTVVEIPRGEYSLRAWRTVWADDFDDVLSARLTLPERRWKRARDAMFVVVLAALVGTAGCLAARAFRAAVAFAVLDVLMLLLLHATRTVPAVTRGRAALEALGNERPSLVFQLRRHAD